MVNSQQKHDDNFYMKYASILQSTPQTISVLLKCEPENSAFDISDHYEISDAPSDDKREKGRLHTPVISIFISYIFYRAAISTFL